MDPKEIYNFFARPVFPVRIFLNDGRHFEVAARVFVVVGVSFLDVGSQSPLTTAHGIWGPTKRIELTDIKSIESLAVPSAGSLQAKAS